MGMSVLTESLPKTGGESGVTTTTDAKALEAFVAAEYAKVVGAVALATRDRDGAEDAVQDAIVKALGAGHRPDNMAAWVTVTAINGARSRQRRADAERRAVSKLEWPEPAQPSAEAATIAEAVGALPKRQREIATLFYYLDTSVADIAVALDVTEGTVKTHLHRARTALAAELKEVA